jgi:cytochrome c oxidase subunit 6a
MFRLGLRTAQQTRAAPLRRVVGRRFNSTENKPSWVGDNAFNRERENVKHHAAATSSMLSQSMNRQVYKCNWTIGTDSNVLQASGRDFRSSMCGNLKRRIMGECLQSVSAVVPCLIAGSVNAYNLWTEHWEHWSHMPPLEERTEYPYQNIRSKNYPWGDGDKVCSFARWFTDYTNVLFVARPFCKLTRRARIRHADY